MACRPFLVISILKSPGANLDPGDPTRFPAFHERTPEDGVFGVARYGDLAGHDKQLRKQLLLRQGGRHGGDSGHFPKRWQAGGERMAGGRRP